MVYSIFKVPTVILEESQTEVRAPVAPPRRSSKGRQSVETIQARQTTSDSEAEMCHSGDYNMKCKKV